MNRRNPRALKTLTCLLLLGLANSLGACADASGDEASLSDETVGDDDDDDSGSDGAGQWWHGCFGDPDNDRWVECWYESDCFGSAAISPDYTPWSCGDATCPTLTLLDDPTDDAFVLDSPAEDVTCFFDALESGAPAQLSMRRSELGGGSDGAITQNWRVNLRGDGSVLVSRTSSTTYSKCSPSYAYKSAALELVALDPACTAELDGDELAECIFGVTNGNQLGEPKFLGARVDLEPSCEM